MKSCVAVETTRTPAALEPTPTYRRVCSGGCNVAPLWTITRVGPDVKTIVPDGAGSGRC